MVTAVATPAVRWTIPEPTSSAALIATGASCAAIIQHPPQKIATDPVNIASRIETKLHFRTRICPPSPSSNENAPPRRPVSYQKARKITAKQFEPKFTPAKRGAGQKMAGLRVGTVGGGPTVQVARPGLGTGAASLGGGDLPALICI